MGKYLVLCVSPSQIAGPKSWTESFPSISHCYTAATLTLRPRSSVRMDVNRVIRTHVTTGELEPPAELVSGMFTSSSVTISS